MSRRTTRRDSQRVAGAEALRSPGEALPGASEDSSPGHPSDSSPGHPSTTLPRPPGAFLKRWLILAAVGVLVVGLGLAATMKWEGWPFAATASRPKEESLIDRFARLHNDRDAAAVDLLGPPAVFDEELISEAEAERRVADFCLRSPLAFVEVLPGEPDGKAQRPVKDRFTLVTKGAVRTSSLRTRAETGGVFAGHYQLTNPDVVVEIRGGKIVGVKTVLPER
jgi:hypothetical protein